MKRYNLIITVCLSLLLIISCDEPDTLVTDIVRPDGSILRKLVMRNKKNIFDAAHVQVPFDSTWTVSDSLEIGPKGDTTWVKRASKLFASQDMLNASYNRDSCANSAFARQTAFSRKFRWFNTKYRFSEIVDKRIDSKYHLTDFLNPEEARYFYSPDQMKYSREHGPDSIKYKMIADTISKKTTMLILKNIVVMWIDEFEKQVKGRSGPELSADSLIAKEDIIARVINDNQEHFDSLWKAGVLQGKFIGQENAVKFRTEIDSALDITFNKILIDFKNYTVSIVMPGKLTATNGYMDSTRILLWPVNADLFLFDRYEMWAESKTPNIWAWIVSGLFILFVLTGIIIRKKSRREAGPKP